MRHLAYSNEGMEKKMKEAVTGVTGKRIFIYKMYEIWTSNPSHEVQDRSKKNPSLVQALGS
jgi:hypothetical protein